MKNTATLHPEAITQLEDGTVAFTLAGMTHEPRTSWGGFVAALPALFGAMAGARLVERNRWSHLN